MKPNDKDARTYQDLMQVLPDVSKIKLWWMLDEDGDRKAFSRVALWDHRGAQLIDVDARLVEDEPPLEFKEKDPARHDLLSRLSTALMIMRWLDWWSLDDEDAGDGQSPASVIMLPSALHVADEFPSQWFAG